MQPFVSEHGRIQGHDGSFRGGLSLEKRLGSMFSMVCDLPPAWRRSEAALRSPRHRCEIQQFRIGFPQNFIDGSSMFFQILDKGICPGD